MEPASQEEVFALLAAPVGGVPVKRIDTHAACVFLAGERVYKVKRAVRFPYLDFSTQEQRKAACEAELEVNRRLAPQLYRRVVPITREADGSLAIDGDGTPVEWAVEMRRFDETQTLDHLAAAGRIDETLADGLGRAVAAAHAGAPQADGAPWIAAVGAYVEEHDQAFRALPDLFAPQQVARLTGLMRESHARIRPLLEARAAAGLVRRLHGDLHLGNIVLIEDEPVLFDAIEFSPLIASGDVLYDLAFLLMDLTERGLDIAANVVFNRYLAQTRRSEDLDALAALPFFLAMRAAIRAKVTAVRLQQAEASLHAEIRRTAATYFRLALRLIAPAPARLVAVGGLSGTGKSVLARALAPTVLPVPGAVLLRSDVERKALFGVAETERLPASGYTESATREVYATLGDKARRALRAGHSAVVDAVFAREAERDAVADVAKAAGAGFTGLFLAADVETRVARVGSRARDASDADAAVARLQEGYALGAVDWTVVDASGTPAETLERAKRAL